MGWGRKRQVLARKILGAAVAVSVVALSWPWATGLAVAAGDPLCPDVEVVFARGTFEDPGIGRTGRALVDAITNRLPGNDVGVYAVDYPASLNFDQAVLGVIDARNKVASIAAECSDTRIVVGGYSQGAAVAGYTTADAVPAGYVMPDGIAGTLPASVSSHVAAVVLFGTPSESFLHLVDRNAPPIVISGQWIAKTLQLCAPRDPVCSSSGGLDRAAHGAYQNDGSTEQAADFVASQLTSAPAAQHV